MSWQNHILTTAFRLGRRIDRLRSRSLAAERSRFDRLFGLSPAKARRLYPDLIFQTESVEDLRGEWIRPIHGRREIHVLYLHGGGFTLGSCTSHRRLCADLSRKLCANLFVLDYSLAPECPFPAALNECLAAYLGMLRRGIDPGNVAIGGDSAGGNLALATLLRIRDARLPMPRTAFCLTPSTDLTRSGPSVTKNRRRDALLSREQLLFWSHQYLAGASPRDPLASPLFHDLRGLPPLLLQAGSHDLLLDDSIRFAEIAKQADVDVTLQIWPGMQHVWHLFAPVLPESGRAIEAVATFLNARLSHGRDHRREVGGLQRGTAN